MQAARTEMKAINSKYNALKGNKHTSRLVFLREIKELITQIDELRAYCKAKRYVGVEYKEFNTDSMRKELVGIRASLNSTQIDTLPDDRDTLRTCPKCLTKLKCLKTVNYPKQIERIIVCKKCGYSIVTVERLGGDYGNNEN